jgi:Holliday junction DNA helicase RuvA
MIGKLKGKIEQTIGDSIILDVSGVGYKVSISSRTLNKLSKIKNKVTIYTHTYVREDALALFGFETIKELSLFEKLISISGIGAKIALSVISSGSVEEITKAVNNADLDFFISIPGIGKKSAQRLIVDLKAMLGDQGEFDLLEAAKPEYEENIEELKKFGFKDGE